MFSFDLIGIGLRNFFLVFLFMILSQFYVHDHEVCKLTGFNLFFKKKLVSPRNIELFRIPSMLRASSFYFILLLFFYNLFIIVIYIFFLQSEIV
jgi:hypothetical protein